ncbi:MAG TPA: putative zinc-binding metallopeptidase [Vicinamibacterales bacterium]|nr:putative zinc-binding metallopeptidase [Vicinamibacterales bacterium]
MHTAPEPEPQPQPEPKPSPLPADWETLPDEQLLDVRMAVLPVGIEGSWVQSRVAQLQEELAGQGLQFPVTFYLSDEWFTPDGVSAVAIPFYLAHPRLQKLEEAQMLEVEGGDHAWCMRLLRHEAGHAIDNAYRLRRRRQRRELFGSPSVPYPEFYAPRPYSRSYVQHLDSWYAQSHPDEDFAETFAVWLTPDSGWRSRYAGWPALKKLEYIDGLMGRLRGRPPAEAVAQPVDPLPRLRRTLRQHYRRKRRRYGLDPQRPAFYDRDLRRLFSDAPEVADRMSAAQFLARLRRPLRTMVASWTGIYQYTIDQVLEEMIDRCRELKLRLAMPEDRARQELAVLLTVQSMNYLHSGGHRLAL